MALFLRIVIFVILLFLIEFYFIRRVKNSLKNILGAERTAGYKNIIVAACLFFNIYPVFLIFNWSIAAIAGIPVWVPENSFFDYLVIYPFWVFILLAVQASLFFLILDLLKVLLFSFLKRFGEKRKRAESVLVLIFTIFFLVYIPARIIFDYNIIEISRVNCAVDNLPAKLNGFKIVFVSDMQADRYTDAKRLEKFISMIKGERPGLVLMGGDVITSTPEYIGEASSFLGKIKSQYGVFTCVGDHDNWAYRNDYARSLREIKAALADNGIEMIDDGRKIISVDGEKIAVTFITNTYVEHIDGNTLDSLTSDTAKYAVKILLTHQPRENVAVKAAGKHYNLMLAGHTHGGQITFLFPFINLTPTLLETKYVRGDFKIGGMLFIVNRGLGMSLAPVRYNSTPEITVITLVRKDEDV